MAGTVKIKICGITNRKDAEKLSQLDINALGFIVIEKEIPSRISVEQAKEIIASLSPFVVSVLGLGDQSVDEVVSLCEGIRPDSVQIQRGLDSAEELRELKKRVPGVSIIKAIYVDLENPNERVLISSAREFIAVSDALLIHPLKKEYRELNLANYWELAKKVVEFSSKPVILAGGLNVQNVAQAIKIAKPYAVDLIRGVETIPGKKDFKKVEELIKIVRGTKI
jgi:phosphoribosylanthranilate isomerase